MKKKEKIIKQIQLNELVNLEVEGLGKIALQSSVHDVFVLSNLALDIKDRLMSKINNKIKPGYIK